QQPIIIAESDDGFLLVAGAHRLEAARLLGWKTIVAVLATGTRDELRLVEIDENLARRHLSVLDRAIALGERKRIYEALHPETKRGGDRKSAEIKGKNQNVNLTVWSVGGSAVASFSELTAEKLGVSKSKVERAVRIAAALTPELREALTGHPIAENQGQLLKLVKLQPADRDKVIAALTREADPAASVQEALAIVQRRPKSKEKPAWQKAYDALYAGFHRAPAKAKRELLASLLAEGELDAIIAQATATPDAQTQEAA
ncbi:MAG: ParB N-terminal domain-containing protein, partial [Alphaproteobacteria bacterium]|nr:ParB N-terminal domain-containing protein [Alphaproteobacteria bacterium]